MTYLKDGYEYLDAQELRVYRVIQRLNAARRATNSSQVAAAAGISRTTVTGVCHHLKARGFLVNAGKGAAYHWQATSQPVPYSTEVRHAAIAERTRQRELNDQARSEN